jgi:hypothetical protein
MMYPSAGRGKEALDKLTAPLPLTPRTEPVR